MLSTSQTVTWGITPGGPEFLAGQFESVFETAAACVTQHTMKGLMIQNRTSGEGSVGDGSSGEGSSGPSSVVGSVGDGPSPSSRLQLADEQPAPSLGLASRPEASVGESSTGLASSSCLDRIARWQPEDDRPRSPCGCSLPTRKANSDSNETNALDV